MKQLIPSLPPLVSGPFNVSHKEDSPNTFSCVRLRRQQQHVAINKRHSGCLMFHSFDAQWT